MNHWSEVFWQPKYRVDEEGDQAAEKMSPASVSKWGFKMNSSVCVSVDQTCGKIEAKDEPKFGNDSLGRCCHLEILLNG